MFIVKNILKSRGHFFQTKITALSTPSSQGGLPKVPGAVFQKKNCFELFGKEIFGKEEAPAENGDTEGTETTFAQKSGTVRESSCIFSGKEASQKSSGGIYFYLRLLHFLLLRNLP